MPELSRLVIEVDSKGVLKAEGDLSQFQRILGKTGKDTDDLTKKFGAFQLVVNKLPGPLKSVVSGIMGIVSPATVAASALAGLGVAAVKNVKESIQAYQDYEVQVIRLGAVLEATGSKAWTTSKELSNYARSLSVSTGRSSNEIMQMQSVLLGFTGIAEENFNRLTKNMVDMADVMGGSMVSAANTFGKALENPTESIGALSRYGFKFTDQQKNLIKELEKTNDLMGAQKVILESMEKAFGGAAEATGKSIDGLKRRVSGLKEEHKALSAEYYNMISISKWWNEMQMDQYTALNDVMAAEIELRTIRDKKNDGTDTASDLYREAEIILKMVEKTKDLQTGNTGLKAIVHSYRSQENTMKFIINRYQPMIDAEKKRTSELEKQLKLLEDSQNVYKTLIGGAKEWWEKSPLGQIEKLEENISELGNYLKANQKDGKKRERVDGGIWIEKDVKMPLSPDDIKYGTAQLEDYRKQLKKLKEDLDNVNKPFRDWVQLLSQATGFSETAIGGVWNEESRKWQGGMGGLATVEKYADELQAIQKRFLSSAPDGGFIYEALGLNESDVFKNTAQQMQSLVQMMTGARIKDPWSVSNESYQRALELLEKYSALSDSSAFKAVITELERERKLIEGSVNERVYSQIEESLKSQGVNDPTTQQVILAMNKNGENHIASLTGQLNDAGKSTYDLAVKRLMLEHGITEETAQQAISVQKQIDYITSGYDFMGGIAAAIDDALRSIRSGEGGHGQYAGARFAQAGMQMAEGSDAGNFINGLQQGGIWGAIIETLVGALVKVVGGMEEMDKVMNPVTELFSSLEGILNFFYEILSQLGDEFIDAFKPVFALFGEILQAIKPLVSEILGTFTGMLKDIFATLMPVIAIVREVIAPILNELSKGLRRFYDGLRWFVDKITGGLFSAMNDWADTIELVNKEKEDELARLKAINEQYKNLLIALREQEEYYLTQRRSLNAQFAIEQFQARSVNDMILSPHGAFSTDPRDYIIATKNPHELMGGSTVNVHVHNNTNATVTTQERTGADGSKEIIVLIDGVIQQGLASGKYDGAFDAMNARRGGMRVVQPV